MGRSAIGSPLSGPADIKQPLRNRLCRAAGGAPWGEAAEGRFGGSQYLYESGLYGPCLGTPM